MKRTILLAVTAIVALMAASCQKEEMGRILTATIEQYEHDNKAYIDNDNYACWENDDHVNINGNPYAIRITDGEGRANTATIVGSDNLTGNLMAFYPADMANISSDGTGGTVTLPQTQTYRENNGHQVIDNPMAAYCPDGSNELRFRNLAALLKVTIHATEDLQVRAIQVKGDEDQMLWGTSQITLDYQNKPLLGKISDGGASVRLYFETPAEISAGANKSFYIVVPAGADFFDFTIAVLTNQGDAYLKTNRIGQTLPRNHIGAITYTPANNDTVTAMFYTGNLEGFNQNASGGAKVISSDGGIIFFDRYFTSIWENAFNGCINITSITLPDDLTSIGEGAFYGCSSLTSISLPDDLTTIGNNMFFGCSSLRSIILPESVTSIGDHAFCICSSLTSISLPESVTSIGHNAFRFCSSLTSITLPENLTTIGDLEFGSCTSLTTVYANRWVENGDPEITPFGYGMFYNCPQLSHIYVPAGAVEAYKTGWGEPYSGMIEARPSK